MGMVREDVLTTYFGSKWSRVTNKKADTSAERGCQKNGDINEWKRRGIFLLIFLPPPFCQWIRPKSINHN